MGVRPRSIVILAGLCLLVAADAGEAQERARKPAVQQELEAQAVRMADAMRAAGRPVPQSGAEAEALSAKLARDGYRRLADDVLLELLRMRVVLAEGSPPPLCAGMWTGSYGPEMLPAIVMRFSVTQQRRWAQIYGEAQLAEIHNRPARRSAPGEAELAGALERFFREVPAADAAFLATALEAPARLAADERCRATRLYYRRLSRMAPRDALVVFRASLFD